MRIKPEGAAPRRMKHFVIPAAVLLTLNAALAATSLDKTKPPASPPENSEASSAVRDRQLHIAGNLRVSISNNGTIGNQGEGSAVVPSFLDEFAEQYPPITPTAPLFESPAGSEVHYLFYGGLWVGGIVKGDTLVSSSVNSFGVERGELVGHEPIGIFSNLTGSGLLRHGAVSQHEMRVRYSDTALVGDLDEYDPRPHIPLGVEITQTSHTWLSEPYDDFVIVVYSVKNIATYGIEDVYLGLLIDADVFSEFSYWPSGFMDDISGYLRDEGIAYTMDNDGDPGLGWLWDEGSARGAIGVVPLSINPVPTCTTYNWWTAGSVYWVDDYPNEPPEGDRAAYRSMAAGVIETDQIWTAVNDPLAPSPLSMDVADGEDVRMMVAYGAFDLLPGDSVLMAMALVAGDSIHPVPPSLDVLNPEPYYLGLYFNDLIRNAEAARLAYASNFNLTGGAPAGLTLRRISDTDVHLHWNPAPFHPLSAHRIYRRGAGDVPTPWLKVGETSALQTSWTDGGLIPAITLEYCVSGVDTAGAEGFKSRAAPFVPGLPVVVPEIESEAGETDITLRWSVESPGDHFGALEYVNIYRRTGESPILHLCARQPVEWRGAPDRMAAAGEPGPSPIWPLFTGEFTDTDVESGVEYWYSASVTNIHGLEGSRSEETRAIPMALDHPGIVIVEMDYPVSSNPSLKIIDADSTVDFYFTWARLTGFDTAAIDAMAYPPDDTRDSVLSLRNLSRYALVVLVWEDPFVGGLRGPKVSVFEDYLLGGGKCILAGRNIPSRFDGPIWTTSANDRAVDVADFSFVARMLGIRRVVLEGGMYLADDDPLVRVRAQFADVQATGLTYPDLTVDTSKALAVPLLNVPTVGVEGDGFIPIVGGFPSVADAEVLYTYEAASPDTSSLQGLPVALRGHRPNAEYVIFGFPLSLMEQEAAFTALDLAVIDLVTGVNEVSDMRGRLTSNEILDAIYFNRGGDLPPNLDVNRDSVVDLLDAVYLIDQSIDR